jgi:phenylpropionate dioxygenase-like ring-hydroxylating dioxygenase large terminal subunit
MVDLGRSLRAEDLVDVERGLVDRHAFFDQEIYDLELERIFARAWNFMCHESQIPNPGDFFMNFIGEESVIATRDKEGGLNVLLNTCRHRGNAVCRAEQGHASSFMCTYHGWTYSLKGDLVGVPGSKDLYHGELDRDNWGLIRAPHVESYKGFVFANMDPDAPPLEEYLGEVGKIGLSLAAEQGDMEVIDGVQKFTIGCNWKFAVDNLFDWYHPQVTHASSFLIGGLTPRKGDAPRRRDIGVVENLVMLGEYGHAIAGPTYDAEMNRAMGLPEQKWRERAEAIQGLGPVGVKSSGHPNIFPNLWVTGAPQLSLRLPKGPAKTEIWWFTLIDKNLPIDQWNERRARAISTFGPAGWLEQEDGENWDQSTRGTRGVVARRYPLNFSMGLGHGEVLKDDTAAGHVVSKVSEHAQLWTYRAWAEWLAAESWQELKQRHSLVPDNV